MYDINVFENLIKSNMSAEEICAKIFEFNPVQTKERFQNDDEAPFAVYVGGVGENDLVTVNKWLYPLTMKFDDKSVFVDFVNKVRDELNNNDKPFKSIVINAIKKLTISWFYDQNDELAVQNAQIANEYVEATKDSRKQRDGYAGDTRVSYDDEELHRTIYGISKFKGVGQVAKCVEVNTLACNLLAFAGFESVLVQGYYVDYKGNSDAHTFPLVKNSDGQYSLFDCMLKMSKRNILPGDHNFEEGIQIQIPVTLTYSDGRKEQGTVGYTCPPQKRYERSGQLNQ